MRILLVGNYIPDKQESMLRYADLMHRELLARGHDVTLLSPPVRVGRKGSASGSLGKWLGYIDKFVLFPGQLRRAAKKAEVVHICDHSNAMYVKDVKGTAHVVTCHDVLAIKSALGEVAQNQVSSTGRKLQQLILNGLKAAQYIVCDSEISQEDLLRVTGRPASTSEVVYLSLNYPYTPMPLEGALATMDKLGFDARQPFFLHVGGAIWYKNRVGVVGIFDRLQQSAAGPAPRLLFIGGKFEPELDAAIAAAGLQARVFLLSGVSNEDLRAAYSLAEAFLFPSFQEGFGWPVLEAQSCGCPVFATNRKPMTELGGDAAVYFDPADLDAAAQTVREALPHAAEIRAAGLVNVQRFTIQHMIDGYLKAYRHVRGVAEVQ